MPRLLRLLLTLVAFWAAPVAAQDFPAPEDPYVNDLAQVLTPEAERNLRDRLRVARNETGVHVTLLTLQSRAPYAPGLTLETFATALFNDWGIGDAERDDGILLMLSLQEREVRIELGRGFGSQWDSVTDAIMQKSLLPAFREGEYARGLEDGAARLVDEVARPFATGAAPGRDLQPFLFAGLFALIAGAMASRRHIRGIATRLQRCPSCGRRALDMQQVTEVPATRVSAGQARRTTRCAACGHEDMRIISLPRRRAPRRGHAGGGFGGGASGGGGSSGRF